MALLYSRILAVCHGKYFFLLFSFITAESAFKMASMQGLFTSISLCVTTLIETLTWTVTELY